MESLAQTVLTAAGTSGSSGRRRPDYRLAAVWGALMLLIGAGFWVFGMALDNEALAAQEHKRYMDPIYYCATGVEFPAFEPSRK